MKKLILRVLIGLAVIAIALIAFVEFGSRRSFSAPYPDIRASQDPATIDRGEYLSYGPALCSSCHVPSNKALVVEGNKMPLIGGWELDIPPATLRAANLTPDKETGLGNISDAALARAIRYGVGHDNRLMMNVGMPFPHMTDEDLTAIISFLRSQPPVKNSVEPSQYKFLGKALVAFGALKPQYNSIVAPEKVEKSATVEYGSYLAKNISNCMTCHSNIDPASGELISPPFSGGFNFGTNSSSNGYGFVSPNITPHQRTGVMANWTEEMFLIRFKAGIVHEGSPMPWGAISRMDSTDLKAIYRFIQSLDPVDNLVESTVYRTQEK